MNNLLPTLDTLKVRYPDYFPSDKCFFCNLETEDMDHLMTCQQLSHIRNKIAQEVTTKILNKVKNKLTFQDPHIIQLKLNSWIKNTITNNHNIMTRGFARSDDLYNLSRIIPLKNDQHHIIRWTVKALQHSFMNHIWKPRNQKYNTWCMKHHRTTLKQYIRFFRPFS